MNPLFNPMSKKSDSPFKVLKIVTQGNEDEYYISKLFYQNPVLDSITIPNNDTLTKVFLKKDIKSKSTSAYFDIIISTPNNRYKIFKSLTETANDTLLYVINYDTVTYKKDEIELENLKRESDSLDVVVRDMKIDRIGRLFDDIKESYSYYDKRIKGKSRNKAADFLYSEGFSHDYFTGETLGEKFTLTFTYGKIPRSTMSYTMIISFWYSYGYGNLYYKIEYDYNFDGQTHYHWQD